MLGKLDDSKRGLLETPELCFDYAVDSLLALCLTLEMEGKCDLKEHVAHQTVLLQFLLQLACEMDANPTSQSFILMYFSK